MLLRYGAGLSGSEIAEALGISSGAARMRLSRAMQRLADHRVLTGTLAVAVTR